MKKNVSRKPIGKKQSSHDAKSSGKRVQSRNEPRQMSWFFYLTIVALIIFSGVYFLYQETGFDPIDSVREIFRDRGPVAATVNGQRIYFSEVENYYARVPEPLREQLTKDIVLDQIISQEVLVQEARRLRISVSDRELDELISNAIIQSGWTEEQFNQIIAAQGMTIRDLKDLYRVSLVIEKLINQTVLSQIEIADDEVAEYYDANIASFQVASDQVEAQHILIRAGDEFRAESEALSIAEEIRQRAVDGEDFSELAVQYSEDLSVEDNQGNLGFFARGMMVQEFEDAAFSLDINEISEPVLTDFGYHVILVLDRRNEGDIAPLSEVQEQIRNVLLQQRQQSAVEQYIRELRENANIQKFTEDLPPLEVDDDVIVDDGAIVGVDDDVIVEVVDDELDAEVEDLDVDGDVVVFEFNADGFNFVKNGEYGPTITVNLGDTVRIEFTNDDAMPHDWVLDEFDARTEILQTGEFEAIEFVADQVGEFEYYCSVGQHRERGMVGTLIVQ